MQPITCLNQCCITIPNTSKNDEADRIIILVAVICEVIIINWYGVQSRWKLIFCVSVRLCMKLSSKKYLQMYISVDIMGIKSNATFLPISRSEKLRTISNESRATIIKLFIFCLMKGISNLNVLLPRFYKFVVW